MLAAMQHDLHAVLHIYDYSLFHPILAELTVVVILVPVLCD